MEKKSDLKGVLLGVFLVISLLLGGFIVYDKLLKKEGQLKCKEECQCEKCEACEKNTTGCNCPSCDSTSTVFYQNMVKNRKTTNDFGKGIEIVLDKNGNVYYRASKLKNPVGTKGSYKIDGYAAGIDSNGNLSNVLDGYKLNVSNVVAIYNVQFGQAGYRNYILIKADGTIAKLTYSGFSNYDNGDVPTINIEGFKETVSGYKNIVGAVQSNSFDGTSYKLIDINGNIYDIYD